MCIWFDAYILIITFYILMSQANADTVLHNSTSKYFDTLAICISILVPHDNLVPGASS